MGQTEQYQMFGNAVDENVAAILASAATVEIGYADGNTVHVAGTTTITSFGAARKAGAVRRVIFDDALVLTHGASLILPGGASILTAAGDIGVFVADTPLIWRCVSYTPASASVPSLQFTPDTLIASGAIVSSFTVLDGTDAVVAATLADLEQGKIYVFTCLNATNAVTVALDPPGTFDGTNTLATFDAPGETLVVLGIDGTDGIVLNNSGAVALSAP